MRIALALAAVCGITMSVSGAPVAGAEIPKVRDPLRLATGEPMVAVYFFPTWWEPWRSSDRAVLDDMRRLRRLGVNTLLVDCQPSQAIDREWRWLDRTHRLAREADISVLGWLESKGGADQGRHVERVGDFLGVEGRRAVTRDGKPRNALVWDDAFAETLSAYAERYLARYGETGAVVRVRWKGRIRPVLSLNVEAGWEDVSFDEETNERFRRWLETRYDGIEALNRAWGTSFVSLAEIDPRDRELIDLGLDPALPDPLPLADHILFRAETVNAALAGTAARLRRRHPEVLFATEVPYPFDCAHPHAIGYRRRNACIPELVAYADILFWRSTGRLTETEREAALRWLDRGRALVITHRTFRDVDGGLGGDAGEFVDYWSGEAASHAHGIGFYSWNEMVDCHIAANGEGVGDPRQRIDPVTSARMTANVGRIIAGYLGHYDDPGGTAAATE